MGVALVGSPPLRPSYEQLLSRESQRFDTTVGAWTNTGGTLSRDTTGGYRFAALAASLKLVTTATTHLASVPLPPAKLGDTIDILLAVSVEETPASIAYEVEVGVPGTDSEVKAYALVATLLPPGGGQWLTTHLRWSPTANRATPILRLRRTGAQVGTQTYHIGYAQATRVPGGAGLGLRAVRMPGDDSEHISLPSEGSIKSHDPFGLTSMELRWGRVSAGFVRGRGGYEIGMGATTPDEAALLIFGENVPGVRAVTGGANIEVGEDYLGFMISQAAADEVQLFPDFGDYFITFLDGSAPGDVKGWRAADEAGNVTGLLSKAPWRSLAAAPSSPGESEAYYDTVTNKLRVWDGTAWNDLW